MRAVGDAGPYKWVYLQSALSLSFFQTYWTIR